MTAEEPKITFEYNCQIEELANFLSEDSINKETLLRKHTPKEAEERIKYFLAKPNVIELILRRDGELIGCAFSFEKDSQEPKERVFEIKGVHIKSKYRKQGFGKIITEKLMQDTKQKGATKLVLSATDVARRLYEKLGFKEGTPNHHPDSFNMQYEYPKEKN